MLLCLSTEETAMKDDCVPTGITPAHHAPSNQDKHGRAQAALRPWRDSQKSFRYQTLQIVNSDGL